MQRLSGLDAMFLSLETPSSHMHVAGAYVMEPGEGPVSFESIREIVRQRLDRGAVFRRRLVEVPFRLSSPFWVEDGDFDLDYHVRRAALPAPGGERELADFVAQFVALPLDRSRPLWEMHVVEGLAGGRTAVVTKIHHAAIDGISGAEIATAWLDLEPSPAAVAASDEWKPEPLPSEVELLAFAAASLAVAPLSLSRSVVQMMETALRVSERNRSSERPPPPSPFAAPRTSLNQAITPHRRVAFLDAPLDDFRCVKHAFSCTVNDVVLAACAGGLRRYLLEGDELPPEPLVAMVPMSVRTEDERGTLGNRLSALLTSLATDVEDPGERLRAIATTMAVAKEQQQLVGATALADWSQSAFPALLGRAARLVTSTRVFDRLRPIFNVTISNVPGPDFPLYFAGRRLESFHPVGPVAEGVGLNITVMSYCGTLYFGFNASRETVPRIDTLPEFVRGGLDELLCAVG